MQLRGKQDFLDQILESLLVAQLTLDGPFLHQQVTETDKRGRGTVEEAEAPAEAILHLQQGCQIQQGDVGLGKASAGSLNALLILNPSVE
jgi:hypothetical protein